MRVLIVDDDRLIRRVLADGLRAEGVECAEAGSGIEALQAALAHPPDICLLDFYLADMEGLAVARALLARPETSGARIYLLTGSEEEGLREQAEAAGICGVIRKPVTPAQLFRKVTGH